MGKYSKCAFAVAIAASLLAGPAAAKKDKDDDDKRERSAAERERDSITYSSIGLSKMALDGLKDSNGNELSFKDAISLDATIIGLRLPNVQTFGVELDLNYAIIPGDYQKPASCGSGGGGLLGGSGSGACANHEDFQVMILGVYVVGRTPGKIYGMGKIGYRYIASSTVPELGEKQSGNAWSAGVGYRYNERGGFAELGYNKLSDEIESIGFSLGFGFGDGK